MSDVFNEDFLDFIVNVHWPTGGLIDLQYSSRRNGSQGIGDPTSALSFLGNSCLVAGSTTFPSGAPRKLGAKTYMWQTQPTKFSETFPPVHLHFEVLDQDVVYCTPWGAGGLPFHHVFSGNGSTDITNQAHEFFVNLLRSLGYPNNNHGTNPPEPGFLMTFGHDLFLNFGIPDPDYKSHFEDDDITGGQLSTFNHTYFSVAGLKTKLQKNPIFTFTVQIPAFNGHISEQWFLQLSTYGKKQKTVPDNNLLWIPSSDNVSVHQDFVQGWSVPPEQVFFPPLDDFIPTNGSDPISTAFVNYLPFTNDAIEPPMLVTGTVNLKTLQCSLSARAAG